MLTFSDTGAIDNAVEPASKMVITNTDTISEVNKKKDNVSISNGLRRLCQHFVFQSRDDAGTESVDMFIAFCGI